MNGTQDNDKNVSINALSEQTLEIISSLLDPTKYFLTSDNLRRDWQGLATLCNIDSTILPNIERSREPTRKVLKWWGNHNKDEATVEKLLQILEEIDRFDVIEDIEEHVAKDIKNYRDNPSGSVPQLEFDFGKDVLTDDDVKNLRQGKGHQIFDAFVLFADEDINFATELIDTMEKTYNLKFCSKNRDLVGGSFEHDSLIKLITERCRKLIVILSPGFFNSEQNKFLYSYTQSLQIEQKQRKIIPCTYQERSALPPEYRYQYVLEFQKAQMSRHYNFWDKLHSAIKTVPQNGVAKQSPVPVEVPVVVAAKTPDLKSAMHSNGSSLKPIDHGVKFNSLVDLSAIRNSAILPEETISSSISAASLSGESSASKNSKNILKSLKTIFHKSDKKVDKLDGSQTVKSEGDASAVEFPKKQKKLKGPKKIFGWNSHKTKVPVAN